MQSRLQLFEIYYRSILNNYIIELCADVIDIIIDYLLDLYIHELKKKYMSFFLTHTFVYHHFKSEEYEMHSFAYYPKFLANYIFDPINVNLIAFPMTYVPLNCLYRAITNQWLHCCDSVERINPSLIIVTNWKINLDGFDINGIPLVYFAMDIVRTRSDKYIGYLHLRGYRDI